MTQNNNNDDNNDDNNDNKQEGGLRQFLWYDAVHKIQEEKRRIPI